MTSIAEFSACTMFIRAMFRTPVPAADDEGARALLEDIVEHRRRAVVLAGAHRAIAFGLALGITHLTIHVGRQMGMLLVRPRPECHQVCPQACDRIAKWPMGGLVGWPIFARVIARGMRRRAIGEQFDD